MSKTFGATAWSLEEQARAELLRDCGWNPTEIGRAMKRAPSSVWDHVFRTHDRQPPYHPLHDNQRLLQVLFSEFHHAA